MFFKKNNELGVCWAE
ncbi:hypothetical protein F383_29621 [Gossypium arboreum]|uniref:Uncharacterized protein n=1 Tax=Gossypium arboreum TaxID=29729 RepID=A0A0B0MZ86_GOSAR|nr:hypothetical protein F383_29621 [Gossypium arboreum]